MNEDDYIEGEVETDEELCPNCNSNNLQPFRFGKQRIIRCKSCQALLCPRCLSILVQQPVFSAKTLQCSNGHNI